jgi:hypothetical protein
MAPACHLNGTSGSYARKALSLGSTLPRPGSRYAGALSDSQVRRHTAVPVIVGGVVIHWRSQPAGPAHGGAVKSVDHATNEAHLVGLVGFAVHPAVRPGKVVPAAHFNKALQDRICHICHWIFDVTKTSPTYPITPPMRSCFLDTARAFKASVPTHYSVTVGGVM